MTLKRNTFFCRIVALIILIMMVRYHAIFMLVKDESSGAYTMLVVALFYLLNIVSMIGLFIPRRWGFIFSYFALPVSTFLFATSYLYFITDWFSSDVLRYLIPFANALLMIGIVTLHVKRKPL